MLPLAVALFFGRVFCAGVCPLGAIQELMTLKPIEVPRQTLTGCLGSTMRSIRATPFASAWTGAR